MPATRGGATLARRPRLVFVCLPLLGLAALVDSVRAAEHSLPFVLPAGNSALMGFVRVVNRSDQSGEVRIRAIDDDGDEFGPVSLSIAANSSRHFNSEDLESGNASKGLPDGVGDGHCSWRLELETELDILPLAFVRTADGFVTSIHDVAPEIEPGRHDVAIFNPGKNMAQQSRLRLVNLGDFDAQVDIAGTDDNGARSEGTVALEVPAGGACTLTSQELESGEAQEGCGCELSGALGTGTGKWQLSVTTEQSIEVMNVLKTPEHLTNLSTVEHAGFAPVDTEAFEARFVGRRMRATDGTGHVDFAAARRFRELYREGMYAGSYTYGNEGANSAKLVFTYDDDDVCTALAAFNSFTSGTTLRVCEDGVAEELEQQPIRSWTLEPAAEPVGPAGALKITDSVPTDRAGVTAAMGSFTYAAETLLSTATTTAKGDSTTYYDIGGTGDLILSVPAEVGANAGDVYVVTVALDGMVFRSAPTLAEIGGGTFNVVSGGMAGDKSVVFRLVGDGTIDAATGVFNLTARFAVSQRGGRATLTMRNQALVDLDISGVTGTKTHTGKVIKVAPALKETVTPNILIAEVASDYKKFKGGKTVGHVGSIALGIEGHRRATEGNGTESAANLEHIMLTDLVNGAPQSTLSFTGDFSFTEKVFVHGDGDCGAPTEADQSASGGDDTDLASAETDIRMMEGDGDDAVIRGTTRAVNVDPDPDTATVSATHYLCLMVQGDDIEGDDPKPAPRIPNTGPYTVTGSYKALANAAIGPKPKERMLGKSTR